MPDDNLQKEIDAMISVDEGVQEPIQEPEPLVVEPEPEPLVTEPPPAEPPVTEPPAVEPVVTEPPVIEPVVEPVVEPPPESDVDRLGRENEELRKRLDDAYGGKPEPTPTAPAPEPEPAPVVTPPTEVDFLGADTDLDELIRDPAEFNKLLNKVYQTGIGTAREQIGEGVLRGIPEIVKLNVSTMIALREANEKFYGDNVDLKPFKKVVAAVYEDVASEHPDWTVDKCLEETGTESRKRLELHRAAQQPASEPVVKQPNLPPGSRGSRQAQRKPETSGLLNEIDEMNKELE